MGLSDFSGGVQEALAEIIRARLEQEEVQRKVKQQDFQNQRTLNTEGFREREFGEGTRRFDLGHEIDTGNLDLRRDEFGLQERQYEEGAPMRDASLAHTQAQTGDILRRPEAEEQDRTHDVSMENLRGTWGLRTTAASGAEQRRTQSHGASLRTPDMTGDPAKVMQRVSDVRALAQELLDDPNLDSIFGPLEGRLPRVTEGTANAEAKAKRLESLLTLDNLGMMKGVLSDTDIKILERAGTLLSARTISGGMARQELKRILGGDSQAPAATGRAGGAGPGPAGPAAAAIEYDWVNGKLVPRGGGQ